MLAVVVGGLLWGARRRRCALRFSRSGFGLLELGSLIGRAFGSPLFAPGRSAEVVVPACLAEKLPEVGPVGWRMARSQAHYQQRFVADSSWAGLEHAGFVALASAEIRCLYSADQDLLAAIELQEDLRDQ